MEIKTDTIPDAPKTNNKRYMNVNEIANYLGVSRWTIDRLCKLRELPFIPFGRIKRFDKAQVDAELQKRTIKPKN